MRHGEAEDDIQDYQRKLTWKGEEQVYYVAEQLKQQSASFDLILASGAHRTTQTATIIHEYFDKIPQLFISPHLYHFNFLRVQEVLQFIHHRVNSLLLVGHNPGISQFVNRLSNSNIYFSTAQCVSLEINIENKTDTSYPMLIDQNTWEIVNNITPEIKSI